MQMGMTDGMEFLLDKLKVSRYSKVVMATKLREGDEVVSADMMSGSSGEIVICTKDGFMNRYDAEEVSIIEPASFGVKSIELKSRPNDYVVGAKVVKENVVWAISENQNNPDMFPISNADDAKAYYNRTREDKELIRKHKNSNAFLNMLRVRIAVLFSS